VCRFGISLVELYVPCAHWLNWKCGIAMGAARVATPANEDFLLTIARHGTASHVEQVVNKYRGAETGLLPGR
jgi:hypothetical protein